MMCSFSLASRAGGWRSDGRCSLLHKSSGPHQFLFQFFLGLVGWKPVYSLFIRLSNPLAVPCARSTLQEEQPITNTSKGLVGVMSFEPAVDFFGLRLPAQNWLARRGRLVEARDARGVGCFENELRVFLDLLGYRAERVNKGVEFFLAGTLRGFDHQGA